MKIVIWPASAQQNSLNKQLANAMAQLLRAQGITDVHCLDFKAYSLPMYDGDLEQTQGVPETAKTLAALLAGADGVILCAPEYNGGISGSLKNALDWMSRLKPQPFSGKPYLLTGASPGVLGAVRGLWHTRVPFEAVGALVYPDMHGLGAAHTAFNADGGFADEKRAQQVAQLLEKFTAFTAKQTA
jgi:chromate reductase, NAD(P)H dehydrogenase (quinone)